MVCSAPGKAMSPQGLPNIPQIGFCEEKQRLQDEFLDAIRAVTFLLGQQAEAVIDGIRHTHVSICCCIWLMNERTPRSMH